MKFNLRIPDLSVHDERTCAGVPHCKVAATREAWDAAYRLERSYSSELEVVRAVKSRWPDGVPVPAVGEVAGEETILIFVAPNEEEMRKALMLKTRDNPLCVIEVEPEDRADRKQIKKGGVLDRRLWEQGWVPELADVVAQRKLTCRSSLRIGPTELDVQVGRNARGKIEVQIPGAFAIEMTDEFAEQIGKLAAK